MRLAYLSEVLRGFEVFSEGERGVAAMGRLVELNMGEKGSSIV